MILDGIEQQQPTLLSLLRVWVVGTVLVYGCASDSQPADGGRRDGRSADASQGDDADIGRCGDCDDGVACTQDRCVDGTCLNEPNDRLCTSGERCFLGTGCQVPAACDNDDTCDDGIFCNGVERCVDNLCSPGRAPCEGETPFCDEAEDRCVGCWSPVQCDDGVACNGTEECMDGHCVSGTSLCSGVVPYCDASTDRCVVCLDDTHCDDGVACTRDRCIGGACQSEPNDSSCSGGERCFAGIGCQVPPECGDDSACNDGAFCNGQERCMDGRCVPGSSPCGDTAPYCDEAADRCATCIDDAQCDDGLACNGAERCNSGRCTDGTPIRCDDGLACTADRCTEPTGACAHEGPDRDGDGHIAAGCVSGDDCNDMDSTVYPGAAERCNVTDNDCDGRCDEGLGGCRRPIHRVYNGSDYMPTRTTTEGASAGYSLDRANVYYVYVSEVPGLLAAGHRCYNPTSGDHFIAGSPDCEGISGYVAEAPVGYGLPPSAPSRCGAVVLKRYYNPSTGDRIASPHPDEWAWAESHGYRFETDVGQVWLTP